MSAQKASRHLSLVSQNQSVVSNQVHTPPIYVNPSTRLLIEYYVDCFRVAVGLASVFNRHLKQIGKIWGI